MVRAHMTEGRGSVRTREPAPHRTGTERTARAQLRAQVSELERRLAEATVSALGSGALEVVRSPAPGGPRVLSLGELERVRDALAACLRDAHATLARRGAEQERHRARLEAMLLEPGRHRFERVARADLGEDGCGVWQVRPRLGLVGMLMGWWQVKLSSGCPLAT
jgi:hypothetical protein